MLLFDRPDESLKLFANLDLVRRDAVVGRAEVEGHALLSASIDFDEVTWAEREGEALIIRPLGQRLMRRS